MRPKTHEPGIFGNAGNSGRQAPRQGVRNLKGYKHNGYKRDSEKIKSENEKVVESGSSFYDRYLDWIFENFIPGESEKYSIWCFVLGALGSILCFIPFYRSDPTMNSGGILPGQLVFDGPSSNLQYSLTSNQFTVALLLSVIIAIPMLLDVLLDAYYVFRKDSGRKLHWFVRVFLVASLTVPSVLLLVPSTFASGLASIDGYLCVQAFKRIAITTCMFAYVAHEKPQEGSSSVIAGDGDRTGQVAVVSTGGDNIGSSSSNSTIFDHHKLGLKACLTFATYMLYELFWLYAYTLGSNANRGLTALAPLRVTGAFCLCLSFLQLVQIMLIWGWRFMGRTARLCLRKAAFLFGFYKKATTVAIQPTGQQQSSPPAATASVLQTFVRAMRSRSDVNNKNNNHGQDLSTPVRDATESDQAAALNAYLRNGNQAQWTSRDFSMCLFFSTMILIPAGGLVIATACGNPSINALQASAHEISGFVYLQMCFTTLILVLPGFMARYELNQAMAILHEKEHFISLVSIEVRNPLNDVLLNISSVQHELAALVPSSSDPNSAAERLIFMTVIETINEVAHSTEVALATFTDLITINGLDQGQAVVLDKQVTHPWRFFRDVAKPFEIEAKFKRVGFGMTCLDYDKGWSDERSVDVDRHKISQVLRTLVLCSFKATQAGGNVHVTVAIVEHSPPPPPPPRQTATNFTLRALGMGRIKSFSVDKAFNQLQQQGEGGGAGGGDGGNRNSNSGGGAGGGGVGGNRNSNSDGTEHGRKRLAVNTINGYSNEWLVLEVSDNGKALHRREVDGSLLRLRACAKMVELHGGSMHVSHRTQGKIGATFQIKLPCFRLKGQRDNSNSNHINQTARAAANMVRLKADSSDGSSDHGCFGMRNDFAVVASGNNNGRDGGFGESQLDWFVPDFAVDLSAAHSSNREPLPAMEDSVHSSGSKSKGAGNYPESMLQRGSGANSRRGSHKPVSGGSGRRGRSSRGGGGLISMMGASMKRGSKALAEGSSSRPQSQSKLNVSMGVQRHPTSPNGSDAAAAGGGVVGSGDVGSTQPGSITPRPSILMGTMMDLLGQLGQASSNVSNAVQRGLDGGRSSSSNGARGINGGGSPAPGRNSRGFNSSRNSLDDLPQLQQQQQIQSQNSGSELRSPPSRRGSNNSMLKSPSIRAINISAKNLSFKTAADKALKKGADLSAVVTGDLLDT